MIIKFQSTTRFEISNGRHTIISDQPKEAKGTDQGMSPTELLAGSLGSCIAVFTAGLLQRRNIDLSKCAIMIDYDMADNPRRMSDFQITLSLPKGLSDEDKKTVLKAANHCTIHNTLHNTPQVEIEIREE